MMDPAVLAAMVTSTLGITKDLIKRFLVKRDAHSEVDSLASALGIEMASLFEALEGRLRWWRGVKGKEAWLPPLLPFYTEAYDQIKNRIEKLPADVAAATIHFHGYLRFVNGLHEVMKEYQVDGRRTDFDVIYQSSLERLIEIGSRSIKVFTLYALSWK